MQSAISTPWAFLNKWGWKNQHQSCIGLSVWFSSSIVGSKIVVTTYNTATINTATITKNFCCYCRFPRNLAKIDWSRPPKSIYKLVVSSHSQDFVYGPYNEQTVLSWWGAFMISHVCLVRLWSARDSSALYWHAYCLGWQGHWSCLFHNDKRVFSH